MSDRGEPPKKREWGQDDGYDESNYKDSGGGDSYEDPYDHGDSDSYAQDAPFAGDYPDDEFEVDVDEGEVDQLAKEIIQKEFPGLGSPQQSQKDALAAIGGLAYVGCAQIAVLSGIQGLILGSILGAVQTGVAGASQGMFRQPGFGRFVFQQAKVQGKQFGIWLTCFTGMKCSLTFARGGKQDILTVFGSGFFAGSASSLYSRNPPLIAMNGFGSGVIVSVLHLVGFGL